MAKRTTAHRHLPMEITEFILTKLPTKSLLRFQTLSKQYLETIRHPRFIRAHSEQSREKHSNTTNNFVVCQRNKGGYCLARFQDQKFRAEKALGNKSWFDSNYRPICSCDDAVLFHHYWAGRYCSEEYLLWNPINDAFRMVEYPSHESLSNYGLCHDQAEGDYKAVLVFYDGTYTVHSFRHGTWAALKRCDELDLSLCGKESGVFVEGKLYWIGSSAETSRWGIVRFDPTCDGMEELEIFPEEYFGFECHPFLTGLRGHLCAYGDLKGRDVIQFWMLRGLMWEKTVCIDKRSDHFNCLPSLGGYQCFSMGDDEEIVIYFVDGNYIVYDTVEVRLVRSDRSSLKIFPRALPLSLASFFCLGR